jgi:hypothetical protein
MLVDQRWGNVGLLVALIGSVAIAQELGTPQTYGPDGRLFSSDTIDYFLLSRRSYATEDSSGYDGDVRAVRKYPGGGYQIILKHYVVRCFAPFDHLVQVIWSNLGDENNSNSVDIINPTKLLGQDRKESYNLYWAACHEQFRRFK